MMFLADANR